MRIALTLMLSLSASPLLAHPGHLADLAGHDHLVAGAAIGAIALAGLIGILKGKRDEEPEPDADVADGEEAPA